MDNFNKACKTGNTLDILEPPKRISVCGRCDGKGKVEINDDSAECTGCYKEVDCPNCK